MTQEPNDVLPMHSIEAEAGALACVLSAEPGERLGMLAELSLPDFYDVRHRTVFEALVKLRDAGKPLDVVALHLQLQASAKLAAAGGVAYAGNLPDMTHSAAHFPSWLEQVKDFSSRRAALQESARLKLAALEGLPPNPGQPVVETERDNEVFRRLAKLPPAEYDRVREIEAERMGVRVGTLDGEVVKCRPKDEAAETTQGSKVSFPDLEPWPEPVNGAELLNEIAVTEERFVVAPPLAVVAAALFVLHSFAFDLGDISPILFITGPTKRCGKSKFLAVLLRMVCRPFAAASATPAGIYRVIELHHPTLCIDEVDAFVAGDEQLRGLINSGHTRDAAFHLGCASTSDKEFEPRRWSTWTPKIFSGIGRLADTIEDRAIIIKMVRRRKDEPVDRLRHGTRFDDIRRKALRFVNDHSEQIRNGNPDVPTALHDRAADNWTPLFILADLAGGEWPSKARQAAAALSGGDDALGVNGQLLADIRDVFTASGADKLASKDLTEHLAQIEGRPWAEFGKARRPMSPNQLANLLRGFSVSSRTLRIGADTVKGYDLADFSDAFIRNLPDSEPPKGNNVTIPVTIEGNPSFQKVTKQARYVSETPVPANKNGHCYVVTDQKVETAQSQAGEALL